MILQNLAKLYDQLLDDEYINISQPGFSVENISYYLTIGADGELVNIKYVFDSVIDGKKQKEVPQRKQMPYGGVKTSGVSPSLLWGNSVYILGIAEKGQKRDFIQNRFDSFRELNLEFLEKLESIEANALKAFLTRYSLDDISLLDIVRTKKDDLINSRGFLTFQYEPSNMLLTETNEIKNAVITQWNCDDPNLPLAQCMITGKLARIELTHPRIKGLYGGQSSGGAIVSFNERAYESYGKIEAQGLHAPVSKPAAFAYTTSLNYLLSPENEYGKLVIDNNTIVYWAESTNPIYGNLFQAMTDPQWFYEENPEDEQTQNKKYDHEMTAILQTIAKSIRDGLPIDFNALNKILETSTDFHVLGLAPSAARISISFYEIAPFSTILSRLIQHYKDISIGQNRSCSIWRLLRETVSPKSSNQDVPSSMAGATMRSILTGLPYPMALYYAILNRIRADSDDPLKGICKISAIKAGIIKACLLRRARQQNNTHIQEILTMSLNPQSNNRAYLLGRLFAVMEKAQEDAVQPKTTIKDSYFSSASANPSSSFPILLRLYQQHISKLSKDPQKSNWARNIDKRTEEIMELFKLEDEPFPNKLTLDEQGIFVLGYYHQRNDFYKPKKQNSSEDLESSDDTQEEQI